MSPSLVILCLAAFAIVAALVSVVLHAGLPLLDRLAARVTPRHRVRLWLGLAALPSMVGLLAVGASLLPAVGIGHDHCLAHDPHHPHLCPHHMGSAPGVVLFFVALFVAARVAFVLLRLARDLRLSRDTSRALYEASDVHEGARVHPTDAPEAFVLGALRPRVHVSRGLVALGRGIVEAVLAHERVHVHRRDLLWRALCPILSLGHLPPAADALATRVAAAQELAADAEAAESLPDGRSRIAETLVALARLAPAASGGIAFLHGDLRARVHALLDERRRESAWPGRVLLFCALLLPFAVGASHDLVHHELETLLGALS